MCHLSLLNDDCLHQIVDYLDLEDQLALWQSTISTTRLSSVLWLKWQQKTTHTFNRQTFCSKPEFFKDFMFCISDNVKELHLHNIPTYQLAQCRTYRFPVMRKLDFEAYSFEDNDNDIENIILYLFPMLTTLKVKGKRSGEYIDLLRHLTELDLKDCWQLEAHRFERICSKLKLQKLSVQWKEKQERSYMKGLMKLQTLQELQLNMINLKKHQVDEIINLPKFCKFRFPNDCEHDSIFRYTVELRGNDIHSIIFNNIVPTYFSETWRSFENLQQLTFIGVNKTNIHWNILHIKKLNVMEKQLWSSGREFWNMVKKCPCLKTICLSRIDLCEKFFNFDKDLLDTVLGKRAIRLKILFNNMSDSEKLIRQHFRHFNLWVTFGKKQLETIDQFYIQVDFITNKLSI